MVKVRFRFRVMVSIRFRVRVWVSFRFVSLMVRG